MDGIEKITARIEQDVQAEISAIENAAARQAGEIRQRYEAAAARERDAILAHGRTVAAERVESLAGVAALEMKKLTLAAKQDLLSQAFALAVENLRQLPADQYVSLLAALAAAAAKSGREQIVLSPQDQERYGAAVVAEANKRLPDGALTLAPKTRAISGGLLLSQGDVEINCTFDTLINLLRGELTPQVAQVLFA